MLYQKQTYLRRVTEISDDNRTALRCNAIQTLLEFFDHTSYKYQMELNYVTFLNI